MACDLISVGMSGSTSCTENFSGITSTVYIGIPTESQVAYNSDSSEDAETNFFTPASFDNLEVIGVRIKAQSGSVTSTNTQNGGGFSSVLGCLVADDMDKMAVLARTLNNRHDWAAFTSDGNGNFYVLYAPGFDMTFELSGTTGDTIDSDHGDTLTITAAPMRYPRTKWAGHVDSIASGEEVTVYISATEYNALTTEQQKSYTAVSTGDHAGEYSTTAKTTTGYKLKKGTHASNEA